MAPFNIQAVRRSRSMSTQKTTLDLRIVTGNAKCA
jgi:hypothetical protein